MFKYSSRPGTKAAEFSDQISEKIKQSRLEDLIMLQKNITNRTNISINIELFSNYLRCSNLV